MYQIPRRALLPIDRHKPSSSFLEVNILNDLEDGRQHLSLTEARRHSRKETFQETYTVQGLGCLALRSSAASLKLS